MMASHLRQKDRPILIAQPSGSPSCAMTLWLVIAKVVAVPAGAVDPRLYNCWVLLRRQDLSLRRSAAVKKVGRRRCATQITARRKSCYMAMSEGRLVAVLGGAVAQ